MNSELETPNSNLTNGQLIRGLGLTAAIAVNVANVIGTGVFLKARVMTCNVGTPGIALSVWLVAGLLSLAGALTYAELLAMFPRAAGEYGIMRDAYGRPWGFIYGWTQFAIARSASAAALAVGFAIFLNQLLGGSLNHIYFTLHLPRGYDVPFKGIQLIALTAITVTVLINCAAVSFSGNFATVLTSIKVLLLIGVGLGAFFYSGGNWSHLSQANAGGACEGVAITTGGLAGFAAAMLGALWAYDGWNNITFLAGEVKQPERNLPLGLIISMFLVMGLYLLVNIGYYHVLTPTEVANVPASLSVADFFFRRAARIDTSDLARALRDGARWLVLQKSCENFTTNTGADSFTDCPGNMVERVGAVRFVRYADRLSNLCADIVLRVRCRIGFCLSPANARCGATLSHLGISDCADCLFDRHGLVVGQNRMGRSGPDVRELPTVFPRTGSVGSISGFKVSTAREPIFHLAWFAGLPDFVEAK